MKYFKSLQFVNETANSISDENTKESIIDNEPKEESSKQLSTIKKTKGRIKLKIEYIKNKLRRLTTFSKRKIGMMKKAYELAQLTGAQVMLLVGSETGHVYTFATNKLQPMVTSTQGKRLIESCLRGDQNLLDNEATSQTGFSKDYNHNEDKKNDCQSLAKNLNSYNNILLHEIQADPDKNLTNTKIVPHLLAEPKGTLKKLYADINKQSKKGNCIMSSNKHKIEQSPKIVNILPQSINKIDDINLQKDASKQKNLYCNINSGLFLNNDSNNMLYSNQEFFNVFDNIDKETNVLTSSSIIDQSINNKNELSSINGFEKRDFQVMGNQIVFNLIENNIFKKDEFSHNESNIWTNEAINLIKNK